MESRVFSAYQFRPEFAGEKCVGRSETVPNEATSLRDLVRRAVVQARLPEIAKSLEYGDDEDFEDAQDASFDLSDYVENKSFVERYTERLKALKLKVSLEDENKADLKDDKELEGIADKVDAKNE